ncbi:MAG: ABC transporter ATP-binding protein [Candidatus Heimdallarchaeota archaeon]|nr:ABC transporter ATP-binding protein [Candidatus Heimdallarchaeota archaeon]
MAMRQRIEKSYYDKEYSLRETIRRLFAYASVQQKELILMFTLLIINSVVAIALPIIVSDGLNELEENVIDFDFVKRVGWIYFIGTIFEWIIIVFMTRVRWVITAGSISRVRVQMFDKLQEMDLSFYDRNQTGKLMSRVMDDSNRFGNLINIFAGFASSLVLIMVMVGILFSVNVKLTLLILATFPFIILVVIFAGKYLRKFSTEIRRTRAAVNSAVQESVTGVSVAKGFNREERSRSEFVDLNQVNLKANLNLSYVFSVFFPLVDFLSVLVMFIIINSGGKIVIGGDIGIGDLFLFYTFSIRLFAPIIQVSQQVAQLQAGSAATERIFSLLDLKSEMKVGTLIPEEIKGEIEFKDIDFWYKEDEPVYEKLSIKIDAGQNVALVGHTGAGKTTMVSLLARFYEIKGGEILIDGHNIQDIDIETYRNSLGIVLQEPYLFNGSLEDNIRYGNRNATDTDIERAVKMTHLDEFIDSLPEGLQTDVRERGSRLSTGQRQLVTFARALVADPSILILDEATASVDAYTESLIQDGLENLFRGRTSIVVAHRLSTIIKADRILVFDHGKIVGDGSHEELMKSNNTYQELYKTYYEFQFEKELFT